jgi:hypothetical protein
LSWLIFFTNEQAVSMGKWILTMMIWVHVGAWAQSPAPNNAKAKTHPAKVRAQAKTKPDVPPVISQPETPLAQDLMHLAEQVQTGKMVCEASTIEVHAHPQTQGYFVLRLGHHRYVMAPVATSTGALRMEDPKHGTVWIQLANKSMLMDQKLGRRLADECQSPAQMVVAQAMAKMPPINILEPASDKPAVAPIDLANK